MSATFIILGMQIPAMLTWNMGINILRNPLRIRLELTLLKNPELEKVIFLLQLLKYQIPSPLESGSRIEGFHLRPFRLLLHFLYRARDENLIGLTKYEIALYVITVLDENDDAAFE